MATLPADNTFEGGSDETTITTGNSGGGSGTAFEVVTIGGTSALVYDDARAAHGSKSARITAGSGLAQAGYTFTDVTELWGRVYFWLPDPINENIRIVGWEDLGNAAPGRILINTFNGGVIQVLDENFAGDFATAVVPKNEWIRLEWRILCHPTAGELEAKMYQGDSNTPMTNGTVLSTGRDTGAAVDRVTYGHNAGWAAAAQDFWIDSLEANTTDFPGPLVEEAVLGYKRIYGPVQLPNTATTLYTVPAGRRLRIRHIVASNPGGSSRDVTLSIGTDAAGVRILDGKPLAPGERLELRNRADYTLEAGEVLQGFASAAGEVVAVINGYEESV